MATNSTENKPKTRNVLLPFDRNFSSRIIKHIELNSRENTPPFTVDEKLFENINAFADKIITYCKSESIKPKQSLPCIFNITPRIKKVINKIYQTYKLKLDSLNDIEHFNVTSQNLLEKLKKASEPESTSRKEADLIKLTLILSHILADLQAMFPQNVYDGLKFKIEIPEAANFWNLNFKEKTVVPWRIFEEKLNRIHRFLRKILISMLYIFINISYFNIIGFLVQRKLSNYEKQSS